MHKGYLSWHCNINHSKMMKEYHRFSFPPSSLLIETIPVSSLSWEVQAKQNPRCCVLVVGTPQLRVGAAGAVRAQGFPPFNTSPQLAPKVTHTQNLKSRGFGCLRALGRGTLEATGKDGWVKQIWWWAAGSGGSGHPGNNPKSSPESSIRQKPQQRDLGWRGKGQSSSQPHYWNVLPDNLLEVPGLRITHQQCSCCSTRANSLNRY